MLRAIIFYVYYQIQTRQRITGQAGGFRPSFLQDERPEALFISSGDLLTPEFFEGVMDLEEWMVHKSQNKADGAKISDLEKILGQLHEKGVIIEC